MKKSLLTVAISVVMAATALFGQHTQSLSFSDPGLITPGSTFNVSVTLTFTGYNSFGLSYWLEANNALAPFLRITAKTHFYFPDPNQPIPPGGSLFNGGQPQGASSGFMLETTDLGATINDPICKLCLGAVHITDLTFSLAPGAPLGMFTLQSTTHSPRISEVTDTDFNDNNIPAGSLILHIVPEPGTLALLVLAASSLPLVIRRKRL